MVASLPVELGEFEFEFDQNAYFTHYFRYINGSSTGKFCMQEEVGTGTVLNMRKIGKKATRDWNNLELLFVNKSTCMSFSNTLKDRCLLFSKPPRYQKPSTRTLIRIEF